MSILKTKKRICLSVTDFAIPSPRRGSIDIYSGFQSQHAGVQIHQEIQNQRRKNNPNYHSEVWSMHSFKFKNCVFDVAGRIDGVYQGAPLKIEEIKTAFDLAKLVKYLKDTEDEHPYFLQLKTYGYFEWLKSDKIPELVLTLVSQRNKKIIEIPVALDIEKFEAWIDRRLKELIEEIKDSNRRIKKRQTIAKSLSFPFQNTRLGQEELIQSIKEGMSSKSPMLVQAPTGLGKTMGILFPSLNESLARGQKVIYVTPKNSQHQVAFNAIEKLQKKHSKITSLTITAKKKLCLKSQQICNRDYCEFAEDHYTKIEENKLLALAQQQKNITSQFISATAKSYKVCPYELQMQCIPFVETVICDYNYVFSNVSGNLVHKLALGEVQKPNLVIDEIHNLPSRGMGYYSPTLSMFVLEKMELAALTLPTNFQHKFLNLINVSIEIINSCRIPGSDSSHKIQPPAQIFKDHAVKIKEFLANYLASDAIITDQDVVIEYANYWLEFTAALDYVNDQSPEFFTSYLVDLQAVKITCCDASKMLASCYSQYEQVVGFSATVKPFEYYSQLTGIQTANLKTAEFPSPFNHDRRKIVIIPQVSSKFSDRDRSYSRIVEVIEKITKIKPGNYFIFFPSFDFLEKVFELYKPSSHFKVLRQFPSMRQHDVDRIMDCLSSSRNNYLVFAVQGGVLSEGVDYPGDMAIGAFIIGPPLPLFDWEREQMKSYYQAQYSSGFDYTYTYPAMAKAVQSAGRVIRTEMDKGIIILFDNRFLSESYSKCMPSDWFTENSRELISNSILNDIKNFWDE